MDRLRGFSLIELIIVTAIMAILAALATATYGRYAFRSHRSDAHQLLMTIANKQEHWYATYNRYSDDLGAFGYADPLVSLHAYYEVSLAVTGTSAQAYVVTATPLHQQMGDACGSLSIDSSGNKAPGRDDVGANANGSCW